jgi:hypothetical protein
MRIIPCSFPKVNRPQYLYLPAEILDNPVNLSIIVNTPFAVKHHLAGTSACRPGRAERNPTGLIIRSRQSKRLCRQDLEKRWVSLRSTRPASSTTMNLYAYISESLLSLLRSLPGQRIRKFMQKLTQVLLTSWKAKEMLASLNRLHPLMLVLSTISGILVLTVLYSVTLSMSITVHSENQRPQVTSRSIVA